MVNGKGTKVELREGVSVTVQRLAPYRIAELMVERQRAIHECGPESGDIRMAMLAVRMAVIEHEGLKDFHTGEPLRITTVNHPTLGKIGGEEVFDAIGFIDAAKVVEVVVADMQKVNDALKN